MIVLSRLRVRHGRFSHDRMTAVEVSKASGLSYKGVEFPALHRLFFLSPRQTSPVYSTT